jgi:hypothetical protein
MQGRGGGGAAWRTFCLLDPPLGPGWTTHLAVDSRGPGPGGEWDLCRGQDRGSLGGGGVCRGGGFWYVQSGTSAHCALGAIGGPRSRLPARAAVALVGPQGVAADGGVVALMLSRAALVHIWGQEKGSDPAPDPSESSPRSLSPALLSVSVSPGWVHHLVPAGRGEMDAALREGWRGRRAGQMYKL